MTGYAMNRRLFAASLFAVSALPRHGTAQSVDAADLVTLHGVLILPSGSSASSLEDLEPGSRVCGGVGGSILLAESIHPQRLEYAMIPPAEMFTAMQTGICKAGIIVATTTKDAQDYAERLFSRSGFGILPLG